MIFLWMIEFFMGSFCLMCMFSVVSVFIYFITKPKSWWFSLPIVCVAAYIGLETFDMLVRTIHAN